MAGNEASQVASSHRAPNGMRANSSWPWWALFGVLGMCLAHGLWVTRAVGNHTAILDTYRDVGFVQGILDGNLLGDPSTDRAWRWYPPLFDAFAALATWLSGAQPLRVLIVTAPWLNLLVPLMFFLAARCLLNSAAAAFGTVVLVCFDGVTIPPWDGATYSPWSSAPYFALIMFLAGIWLVKARAGTGRFLDAAAIGAMIGITFLAHTVPAIILAVVTTSVAVTLQGLRWRCVAWLICAGAAAFLVSAPFLLPLLLSYHLHISNLAPAVFVDPLFNPTRFPRRVILADLPGLIALAVLLGLGWHKQLPPDTRAILGAWILLPALFLGRHFACGGTSNSRVCSVFVVPVHHWAIYFQAGLACLAGYAVWSIMENPALASLKARRLGQILGGTALFTACVLYLLRPQDELMRERAFGINSCVDLELYQWVLLGTQPRDLFVADMAPNGFNPAATAVFAAGRRSVAVDPLFSNPYVAWQPSDRRRRLYLDLASDTSQGGSDLNALVAEASPAAAYVVLRSGELTRPNALELVYRDREQNVYRVVAVEPRTETRRMIAGPGKIPVTKALVIPGIRRHKDKLAL